MSKTKFTLVAIETGMYNKLLKLSDTMFENDHESLTSPYFVSPEQQSMLDYFIKSLRWTKWLEDNPEIDMDGAVFDFSDACSGEVRLVSADDTPKEICGFKCVVSDQIGSSEFVFINQTDNGVKIPFIGNPSPQDIIDKVSIYNKWMDLPDNEKMFGQWGVLDVQPQREQVKIPSFHDLVALSSACLADEKKGQYCGIEPVGIMNVEPYLTDEQMSQRYNGSDMFSQFVKANALSDRISFLVKGEDMSASPLECDIKPFKAPRHDWVLERESVGYECSRCGEVAAIDNQEGFCSY